jgi:hypothetical protein
LNTDLRLNNMASAMASATEGEAEAAWGTFTPQQIDGRNRPQAMAELTCGTLTNEDDDEDYDEAAVFNSDLGGVGP